MLAVSLGLTNGLHEHVEGYRQVGLAHAIDDPLRAQALLFDFCHTVTESVKGTRKPDVHHSLDNPSAHLDPAITLLLHCKP